jgi:hypothetical protein
MLPGAEINTSAVAHALDRAVAELRKGAAGAVGDVRAHVCVLIGRALCLEAEECSYRYASSMVAVRTFAIRASRSLRSLRCVVDEVSLSLHLRM